MAASLAFFLSETRIDFNSPIPAVMEQIGEYGKQTLLDLGILVLAAATIALVLQNRKMIDQQKKGIEYEIKPLIGIRYGI
ncbi:MAG: hypothetical protein HXS48_10995 [Theionarchaea archaeon]|nr:hypothetical protein [Theionarchaea archaeon]